MNSIEQDAPAASQEIDRRIVRLVGGQTIHHFNEEVRERRWAHYPGAFSQDDISSLFYTVDALEADVGAARVRPEAVDVFTKGQLVRLGDLQHKTGRSHLAVLIDQLRQGSMVRIRDLQDARQEVQQTLRRLEQLFLAACQVNLYLAPAGGAGFPAHFDISDAFIVQCAGAKDWTIYDDYVDQTDLPSADTPWEPERYTPLGSGKSMVLRAGDVLYLPRGVMHAARCTDEHSLHLTISMESLTYADVLLSEIRRLAHDVPELRRRVPWSWDGRDDGLTGTLRAQMHMLADRVEAGPSLQTARRRLVQSEDVAPGTLGRALTEPR
nr:cupin domain-containing protein [Acuticoccus mangrovi]